MEQQPAKKRRGPASKLGKILINLIVTAVVGFLYFYVALPPINLQSSDFYTFIGILCVVYVVSALITSGMNVVSSGGGPKEYLRFIKTQCLPVGILFLALIAVAIVGSVLSMPLFRAAAYRDLLTVEDGNFAEDIAEISFSEIPTLDKDSANFLGDRQMGTLSDMVSQFEYSNDSTQINYQGRPVRVAPIAYADLIKWFTNRSQGLPAYVIVDMVTQEATVVRLEEGMKYSFSEPLNRNIVRHLRFQYPTYMFGTPQFEIDEDGNVETGTYGSVTKDDDDRAYFVIENGMVIYMFVEEVNSKDDAQAAKVEITGEKDVTIGASLTLTANVTLKDPKYDRVTGYQWYYTDSPANYGSSVADIEKHATKIPGATSATYTVDTSAALAGRYFYCVVETYNDKVDGKDTAKSADMSSLVKVTEAVQTVNVAVYYSTDGTKDAGKVVGTEVLCRHRSGRRPGHCEQL